MGSGLKKQNSTTVSKYQIKRKRGVFLRDMKKSEWSPLKRKEKKRKVQRMPQAGDYVLTEKWTNWKLYVTVLCVFLEWWDNGCMSWKHKSMCKNEQWLRLIMFYMSPISLFWLWQMTIRWELIFLHHCIVLRTYIWELKCKCQWLRHSQQYLDGNCLSSISYLSLFLYACMWTPHWGSRVRGVSEDRCPWSGRVAGSKQLEFLVTRHKDPCTLTIYYHSLPCKRQKFLSLWHISCTDIIGAPIEIEPLWTSSKLFSSA